MKTEKTTEINLKATPEESSPWLEVETWDKSSLWQTGFRTEESLWNATQEVVIQSDTSKTQNSLSEDTPTNILADHSSKNSQLAEVVKEELLLTDTPNNKGLITNETVNFKEDSFEVDNQTSLQGLHSELADELEGNDTFFDDLPLSTDINLESSLRFEDLPAVNKLEHKDVPNKNLPNEEVEPSVKQEILEVITEVNSSNLKLEEAKDKEINYNERTVALDVPIHLAPVIRELISLFEKQATIETIEDSTFKNTFRYKKLL